MNTFSEIQIELLAYLADGKCHSGSDLGLTLNVSRTAIWKRITQLIDLGLPIQRIPQKGYRLSSPLILLDSHAISNQLDLHAFNKPLHFHLFATLDSTNRYLKELPHSDSINICCAEMQTAGRGRFGRDWYSPFGENIYCSSRWHFDCDLSRLSGLSLVVSLAIMATLHQVGMKDDILVKWPNDILWHGKKLCGSLIEVIAESNSGADVVIGIGLNVNSITDDHPLPEKPWCSLHDITKKYIDRNVLVAHLITYLNRYLQEFMLEGFAAFTERWSEVDYLKNQHITVSNLNKPIHGIAMGVNENGQLILMDDEGTTHYLSSGDATLHAMGP